MVERIAITPEGLNGDTSVHFLSSPLITRRENAHPDLRKSGRKRLIPIYQAAIFDEAHKIADTARQMYGSFLSDLEVPSLIAYIAPHKLKDKQSKLVLTGHCEHILTYHQ